MASILKVDTIQDQDGNNIINESANTITIGASGDTITIPSGATFASVGIDDNATSTAITIDSSQQVGIGNTSPSFKLDVKDGDVAIRETNSSVGSGIRLINDVTTQVVFRGAGSTRTNPGATQGMPQLISAANYDLFIGADGADDVIFTTNRSERMRINSSGNVGINVSNPSQKLSIIGNAQIENTSASGNAWYYAKNADKTYLMGVRGSSGDALSFYDATTDVERMQIASSGDVTFNNDGADANFTIKDDNNSNLFFAYANASLPYVKTSGIHMHDSDNEGGLSRHQTVTGIVTAPASGTTVELVQVGHTNICNVSIIAKQITSVGGIAYRTVGAYNGLGTGGTVTETYLGSNVTDINIFYQNSGSTAYTINATITYTGTAPTLYFTVDGKGSQNFEKLV